MRTTLATAIIASVGVLSSACVSKGKYDEAVSQTQLTRAELEKRSASLEKTNTSLAKTNLQLMEATQDNERRAEEIRRLKGELSLLERAADADRSKSGTRIAELARRLDELQAAQRASESRAAFYRDISLRLKDQIAAGDLDVVIRDGRMVLRLPNDVLFDSGRTELKPAGKAALSAIAVVLAAYPQRQFQIAGHTDDVPIKNDRFASNWELSSGRALRVLHFLIDKGVPAPGLSAAGYGEIDPIASNANPDGKRQNRRTEITVQPSIDEMVRIP